jgi:hypothetical protein
MPAAHEKHTSKEDTLPSNRASLRLQNASPSPVFSPKKAEKRVSPPRLTDTQRRLLFDFSASPAKSSPRSPPEPISFAS